MKYFVNYDFHILKKSEEKPEPIKKNRRYDHGLSEWVEIDEETYEKEFQNFWNEALNR